MNKRDDRKYNFRKFPALQHKLRTISYDNNKKPVMGITIPRFIAQAFSGCIFRIQLSGTTIFMESGCKITMGQINEKVWEGFYGMRKVENEIGETVLMK